MNTALKSLTGMSETVIPESADKTSNGTDPILVAPMVALDAAQPTRYQGLSDETSGSPEVELPLCKTSSESALREDLRTPEEWWGGVEANAASDCTATSLSRALASDGRRAATGAAISTELAWLVEVWDALPEAVREEVLDVARLAVAADVSVES